MLKRRHTIDIVEASAIADFADEELRVAVFDLLDRAALLPAVLADLIENAGSFSFLFFVLFSVAFDDPLA